MKGNSEIMAPIAIDLGAVYTGVLSTMYSPGENVQDSPIKGVCIKVNTKEIQLSQRNRLMKRHQRRSGKRKKQARRLLFLILQGALNIREIPANEITFLRGLLKRRGFTYAAEELSEADVTGMDPEILREFFPGFQNCGDDLFSFLLEKAQDREFLESAYKFIQTHTDDFKKNNLKKRIKAIIDTEESEGKVNQILSIRQFLQDSYISMVNGARHRKEYLKNIEKDVRNRFEGLSAFQGTDMDAGGLYRLIGNISNLQLRVLRKYFNDEAMKAGDTWNPEKLQKILRKWLRSWHCNSREDHERKSILYTSIRDAKDILHWLQTTDPRLTIPPYEDQNNRRIPGCRSLLLDPDQLDHQFPEWQKWLKGLLAFLDRWRKNQQDLHPGHPAKDHELQEAQTMQRLLDWSGSVDPFRIRYQATGIGNVRKRELVDAADCLKQALGDSVEAFMEFAKHYYQEVSLARQGILDPSTAQNDSCMKQCGTKTKKKSGIKHTLIGQILGADLKPEELAVFLEKNWKLKVEGNQSLASYCKSLEERRKKEGTAFVQTVRRLQRVHRQALTQEVDAKDLLPEKEDQTLLKALNRVPVFAEHMAEAFPGYKKNLAARFGMPADSIVAKDYPFCNPFSMAQIYNILEGESGGYSTTCQWCTAENLWRSTVLSLDGDSQGARASRLPANAGRPFDGMLRRLLERQAREIARWYLRAWPESIWKESALQIPIIIEQNAFDFLEDIGQMKRDQGLTLQASRAKDKADRVLKNKASDFQKKGERIKAASKGVCPYTGENLDNVQGHIDHIIPRSRSRDQSGTVFNSEMNLIYASEKGNLQKGNKDYSLEDLSEEYLNLQFGTTDRATIRKQIEEHINQIEKKRRRAFLSYAPEEQRALRHSLYDSELRKRSLEHLNTLDIARVNGTQAFLVRCLIRELRHQKKIWKTGTILSFSVLKPDSRDVSGLRVLLSEKFPENAKPESGQNPGSHVIDAAMALAASMRTRQDLEKLRSVPIDVESDILADSLRDLIPSEISIATATSVPKYRKPNLMGRSLFKDGIYAERFVPLLAIGGELRLGFSEDNALELGPNAERIFEVLQPFLKTERFIQISYAEIKKESVGKVFVLGINRQKAVEHLFDSREDDPAGHLLSQLRYTVKKAPVDNEFQEKPGKWKAEAELMPGDQKFSINLSVRIAGIRGATNGKLLLPARRDWEDVCEALKAEVFFKEAENRKVDEAATKQFLDSYFRRQGKPSNPNQHSGTRRTFSLPLIASPSGGFRARRRTADGQQAYQLIEADSGYLAGFQVEDNVPNLSEKAAVIIPHLADSKNLKSIETRPESGPYVLMDEWRLLDSSADGVVSHVWGCPNSVGRGLIRARIRTKEANRAFGIGTKVESFSIQQFPEHLVPSNPKQLADLHTLLKKPRNKIHLTALQNDYIVFEYILESTDNGFRNAYAVGIPVDIDEAFNNLGTGYVAWRGLGADVK